MRKFLQRIHRNQSRGIPVWLATAHVLSTASFVYGQTTGGANAGRSWVASYALLVLIVGLGLMLVVRPSGRATELKLPKHD